MEMLYSTAELPEGGFKIAGQNNDNYFLETNFAEADTFLDIVRILPPDAHVMDVGANIGVTAAQALTVLPRSRVLAIEPSPKARACLDATIEANGWAERVRVHEVAVGDRDQRVRFFEHQFKAGSHISEGPLHPGKTETETEVRMTTIDELARDLQRLDLLKIDVEGFEKDALVGAERTIRRLSPLIVMEFNSWTITAFRNASPRSVLDYIRETFSTAIYRRGGRYHQVSTPNEFLRLQHENLIQDGCVTDLVFSPDASKLEPLLGR